jgi:signal transduction histidine kinase
VNRPSPRFAHRLLARLLVIAIVTMVVAVLAGAAQDSVDLRENRGHLPWRFRTVATAAKGLARERGWITHEMYADVDGDGVDDKFRANDHGICGALSTPDGGRRDWQTNLPVAFVRKGPCASIDGVWDLDGDGRAEVVSTAGTSDGFQWRLDVLDAATGERRWEVELPAGSDDRGDGNWDGFFRAFGPFTAHLADSAHPALLVGIEAGYDERPRGVMALDARDGRELWRYLTAAKPTAGNFRIADLDGDGRQEICLLGAGVSNLEEGEGVNGFRDDQARLFVLGDDGALRWERALGQAPASGWLETVDLDADGRRELVVTAFMPELGHEALAVLDAGGAVLASCELPGACHGLTVMARAQGATAWLTFDGSARRYEVSRGAITPGPAAGFEGAAQVALAADMVGDAAPELVLGTGARTWLVDAAWQPLALLDDADYLTLKGAAALRTLAAGERRLVVLGDPAHASAEFVVEDNPRGVPWGWIVAGVAATGAGGAAWRVRRRKLTPAAVRALRLQLLERLVGESHGEIGPLSAAKRLVTFLASYQDNDRDRAAKEQRIRDLQREMLEPGLPQLAAAADVAALAQLDEEAVREARRALAELRQALAEITTAWAGAAPPDAAVADSAMALQPRVENARARFHRLRKLVETDFTASPSDILARSLAARAELISRLGVEVALPSEPVPDCIIDVEDLEFVLDNLIANALRALEAAPRRRLAVEWRRAGDLVALHVQDSGVGMTTSEAAAALEPGEGKREGGGRGLPGSRARLRKYEGKLIVAATAPGEGTTMVLYLRTANAGAATTAPEVCA